MADGPAGGGIEVLDAVVVGAGFAGHLHAAPAARARASRRGCSRPAAASAAPGTGTATRARAATSRAWSTRYQFSDELQQEWDWTERYAAQPEILDYANHVADRFDLRRDIQFDTRVHVGDLRRGREPLDGLVDRRTGDREVSAQFLVMATGCLSSANTPDFPGLDTFDGATYHTGRWPHEGVDFTGKRVAVIGTGSSGVQSIPMIAEQAEQLYVFQRTAGVHGAGRATRRSTRTRRPRGQGRLRRVRASATGSCGPASARARRPNERLARWPSTPRSAERVFERRWQHGGLTFLGAFSDLLIDLDANETAAEFVRAKIRDDRRRPGRRRAAHARTPSSAASACASTPTTTRPTTGRTCTLVDVSDDADRADHRRRDRAGRRPSTRSTRIVFATGFDAMTGALLAHRHPRPRRPAPPRRMGRRPAHLPRPRRRRVPEPVHDHGPGQPVGAHQHDRVDRAARELDRRLHRLPARPRARRRSRPRPTRRTRGSRTSTRSPTSRCSRRCNSWYLGANIPGKPRVFMPLLGFPPYVEKCDEVAAKGYEGFVLSG